VRPAMRFHGINTFAAAVRTTGLLLSPPPSLLLTLLIVPIGCVVQGLAGLGHSLSIKKFCTKADVDTYRAAVDGAAAAHKHE
jgi:hypothetical protein